MDIDSIINLINKLVSQNHLTTKGAYELKAALKEMQREHCWDESDGW